MIILNIPYEVRFVGKAAIADRGPRVEQEEDMLLNQLFF
jgi:hypothetical protein